jgi:hypothetical protein
MRPCKMPLNLLAGWIVFFHYIFSLFLHHFKLQVKVVYSFRELPMVPRNEAHKQTLFGLLASRQIALWFRP